MIDSPAARFDAIVLGAGAAGLMCAARAGQRGKRILVVDHANEPGKKILISGGGRCNFTNLGTVTERFISANSHFARSALAGYSATDFVALVERHGIAWHEKTLGQLFCDGSAKQIVAMLLEECPETVRLQLGQPVVDVTHANASYSVTIDGACYRAPSLVIATGGPSIPKMGATGFAYDLARKFGLKIVEPRPALVPLTLGGEDVLFRDLSGVSAPTRVRCGKATFEEASLFTHRGLSGPAILQISSYWRHGDAIGIDFLPDRPDANLLLETKRAKPRATVRGALSDALPTRLADALADRLGLSGNLADLPDRALAVADQRLASWTFRPNGTEGFAKAEVTVGGVDTAGLSQKTMQAKSVPGLHVIGEAVDVTGWLGGYNFQWAWASAVAAAEAL